MEIVTADRCQRRILKQRRDSEFVLEGVAHTGARWQWRWGVQFAAGVAEFEPTVPVFVGGRRLITGSAGRA